MTATIIVETTDSNTRFREYHAAVIKSSGWVAAVGDDGSVENAYPPGRVIRAHGDIEFER